MIRGRFSMHFALIGVLFAWGDSTAQRADDAQMANQALAAVTRASSPERQRSINAEQRQFLDNVAIGPQRIRETFATLVFNTGLSAAQIQSFTERHFLEVVSAEAKIPMGTGGQVMTVSTGVSFIEGELEDRLRMGTGSMQFRILRAAQDSDGPAREELLEAANAPSPLYYRIDLIGIPVDIQSAALDRAVAGVFVDSTGVKLQAARTAQARVTELRRFQQPPIIRRLEDGPPPGVSPDRVIPIPLQ